MKIRELSVQDPAAIPAVLDAMHTKNGVVMLQMPAVYVLLAPATSAGVEGLNCTKSRLPQKNYGTAIGDLDRFHALAAPGSLPPELTLPGSLNCLTGAFIRFAIYPGEGFHSPVVRSGTHQGVLVEEGHHRALFRAIEASFERQPEPSLFGGKHFTAPLCTSANLSGDPLGSITDWERAYRFAKERRLPLVVRCEPAVGEAGSYPIFYFRENKVTIERHGPGEAAIRERLPQRLFLEKWQEAVVQSIGKVVRMEQFGRAGKLARTGSN